MSKAQNRNMRRKRRQGNVTDNIIEDLVESEGDDSPVADVKRMMIRTANKHKEDIQK
jgi:hypothetical protein